MRWRLACTVVALTLVAACSEPPDKERHQAEGALEAARAASADLYAPEPFQDAVADLKKYDEAVAQRDYRQALNHALEARDRAYEAVKEAGNNRAEQRSQAERLIQDLGPLVTNATAKLTGAQGRPVGPAADRLRAARDAGTAALQETRTRMANQDYPGVIARATPVIAALRKELPGSEPAPVKKKK